MASEFTDILINEIIAVQNDKKSQIKSSEYLNSGKLPIVDQSSNFICGYTNDLTKRYSKQIPVIVFGDHTLHLKYIDFEFATGADGTQILRPLNRDDSCKYLFYLILRETQMMESQGYKRHLKILKERFVSYSNNYTEQKKIASILTSVDEVIENTQKQIDKLQDLKKATVNELLTKGIGHTEFKDSELGRIPKSWKTTSLGNLGEFAKGKGISKDDISNTGLPCIRYAEIYTDYNYVIKQFKSFISKNKVSTTKRLKKNDIVFAGSGETVEDIGKSVASLYECEAYVGGDAIVFSPIDGIDSTFLSYQLNDDIRRIQLRKLGQGSSIVHIYSSSLKHLRVCLPSLNEQRKIASVLTSLGELIEDKRNKLLQTQSLKKSLMQDLLTGKVRVKVN